jgi:hypothetical protein
VPSMTARVRGLSRFANSTMTLASKPISVSVPSCPCTSAVRQAATIEIDEISGQSRQSSGTSRQCPALGKGAFFDEGMEPDPLVAGSLQLPSAMHDEAAVDAESLTGHVLRAGGHEKSDHVRNVFRTLQTP